MNTPPLRALAAVHGAVPAAAMLAGVALVSLLLGDVRLSSVGFVQLAAPVSLLLLAPLASGTAVAVAAVPVVPSSLPDPVSARTARLLWTIAWFCLAVVATNTGQIAGADVSVLAVTRTIATLAGLALLVTGVDGGRHTWLPPTLLVLTSILFGHPDTPGAGHHWWAYILDDHPTTADLSISGALLILGLAVIARPRTAVRRTRRSGTTSAARAPAGS